MASIRYILAMVITTLLLLSFHVYLKSGFRGSEIARAIYDDPAAPSTTKGPWSYLFDVVIPLLFLMIFTAMNFRNGERRGTEFLKFVVAQAITSIVFFKLGRVWLAWQPVPAWYKGGPINTRGPGVCDLLFFFGFGILFWRYISQDYRHRAN